MLLVKNLKKKCNSQRRSLMATVSTSPAPLWWVTATKQSEVGTEAQLIGEKEINNPDTKISPHQLADRIDSFRYRMQYLKYMEFYKNRWISQVESENAQGSALLDGHFLVNQYFNEKDLIFSTKEENGGIEVLNQLTGVKVCVNSALPDLIRKNNYFGSEGVPEALIKALELQTDIDYAPKIKKMHSWVPIWKSSTEQTFEKARAMAEKHCISKTSIHHIMTAYELPYGGDKSQAKFLNQTLTKGQLRFKEYTKDDVRDSLTLDQIQQLMDELLAELQRPFFDEPPKALNKKEAEAILAQPCWGEKEKAKRFLHLFVPAGERDEPKNTAPLMVAGAELEQHHWENEKDKVYIFKRISIERICLEENDYIIPRKPRKHSRK